MAHYRETLPSRIVMPKSTTLAFFLVLAFASASLAAWKFLTLGTPHAMAPPLADRPEGGDFTLKTADGAIALHDLRGKVVLLYFGYTKCPDVCPTSLALDARALTLLSPQEKSATRLLFVSLDPERDALPELKAYAAYFDPEMIAATGTLEEVAAVARSYGVGYTKRPPQADGSYAVDHSAQTYLIDKDGRLRTLLEFGAEPATVAAAVREALRQP